MSYSRRLLSCLAVLGLFASQASAAEPVRVGLLGMDNYQGVAYTHLLNDPRAARELSGVRVTAGLLLPSSDYPESVALGERWMGQAKSYFQKPRTPGDVVPPAFVQVNSIEELFQKCDGVIMAGLDGRMHLEQATAALNAKKRLYITRPAAASLAHVVAIYNLALKTGTPIFSSSQHRFVPAFAGMRDHPEVGKVIGCDVYGGYELKGAAADELIQPLHSIETLYAIMGGPGVETVTCDSTPTVVTATLIWKDGRVGTYRGIKEGKVKYSATVFGDKGVSTAGIYGHGVPVRGVVPTNDKYMGYEGICVELAKFFKGGPPPVSAEETVEIFAVLEAMKQSAAQKGTKIHIAEVLETTPKYGPPGDRSLQ